MKIIFLKRILTLPLIAWGVITITFMISHVIPGDPTVLLLGDMAGKQEIEHTRRLYHLDKPLSAQYLFYIKALFKGDLGKSLSTQRPVSEDLKDFFPASVELIISAIFLAILFGIPIGIISATKRNSLLDHFSRIYSLSGVSMPHFWFGIILQLLLAFTLRLLPVSGRSDFFLRPEHITGLQLLDSLLTFNISAFFSTLKHLIMPAFVLSFNSMAIYSRMTRAQMLEIMERDYIRTARAGGLSQRKVIYKYALKNALIPVVTSVGMSVSYLFGATVIVESVFDYPGLGLYLAKALLNLDFSAIMGTTLLIAMIVVVVNTLVDLVYMVLDARIRYK
jgi:peptide/nickel transport system permease protein